MEASCNQELVWLVVGAAFGVLGAKRGGIARSKCIVAGIAFLLFGCSDIVEVRTGAWWRPWWLLAWKAGCILTLLALLFDYWRGRRGWQDSA